MNSAPNGSNPPTNPKSTPPIGPLSDGEIQGLRGMDVRSRAEWMLEDCARFEQVWGLSNAEGWVVVALEEAPPGRAPWGMPLWPRADLAARTARGAGEEPRRIGLDELLDDLLPALEARGWQVLACPLDDQGLGEGAAEFGRLLEEAWTEWDDEAD